MVFPKYVNSSSLSKELLSIFIVTLSYMETDSTWWKTCLKTTLSTTNPTWSRLGLNPNFHSDGLATNQQSPGTVSSQPRLSTHSDIINNLAILPLYKLSESVTYNKEKCEWKLHHKNPSLNWNLCQNGTFSFLPKNWRQQSVMVLY